MSENKVLQNPRIIVVQKLYGNYLNKSSLITFPKHRYKKFIKDVVNGTIERKDLIESIIKEKLNEDINENKTELIIIIMLMASIYEFMYMHKIPIKVIIAEYLKVSDFFIDKSKKRFLNAILDKASKFSRSQNE